jgi:hypothetical protein
MRLRNAALIVAVFGAAAATTAFVVSQLPLEGQISALPPAPVPAAPAERSPPLSEPATAADGVVQVHVTAGPEPIAGAEVRLYLAPEDDGAGAVRSGGGSGAGAPWRLAARARTDASGLARLPARPGVYLAAARAPGLAPGRAEVVRTAGEPATPVHLVLEPPADVAGHAVAIGGGPVAGARVRLVPLPARSPTLAPPSAPPEETVELRTDPAGAFRAAGLTPGSWALVLEASGYHPVSLPRVAVPGPALLVTVEPLGTIEGLALLPDGRPATGAAVRAASADHGAAAIAGPDGRYRLAVPAGSYAVLAVLGGRGGASAADVSVAAGATTHPPPITLAAAAAVEGTVTRAAGAAPGAELLLLAHGTPRVMARAVAGDGGRFAFGPLAPAAYDLVATAKDASPTLVEGVTVAAGERFVARVALTATGAVTGTVRDPAGHPLAGVRVHAVPRDGGLRALPPVEARTDFEGRFRLAPLAAGRVDVVAREEALAVGTARAVVVADGRDATIDLVLPGAGVLSGRISASGRPPPPGTTVVAVPLRAGEGLAQAARAAADAHGGFELPLPAGEYRVHAALAGALAPGEAGPAARPGAASAADLRVAPAFVRVEPGRTARVALAVAPSDGGVEILVLEPGGAPSPGAQVTLARADDARVALAVEAGDDGRVVLDPRMGMGGRPVTIRARNGGRSGAATLPLPEAGTVAVHLGPGGGVAGIVRGARAGFTLEVSSQPAAGTWRTVQVHRYAGERFALGDLPAEPLRLVARSEDGRRGAIELRIAPGETRAVEIAVR